VSGDSAELLKEPPTEADRLYDEYEEEISKERLIE
jgi:hypothetical protein